MSRTAGAFGIGLALVAMLFIGCAASQSSDGPVPPAGSGGEAGAGSPGSEAEGGSVDEQRGGSAGKGGMSAIITDPNGEGGMAEPEVCAADTSTAEVVPLDMYIMLDVSGSMAQDTSMFDSTGTAITKWSAIKTAIKGFLVDEASNGIGVGIQYFPVMKDNVPAVCTSNADCGDSAPCAFKACASSGGICQVQGDCPGSAIFDPCLALGTCGKAQDPCWVGLGNCLDDFGTDLGPCLAITESVCAHPAHCDAATYATPAEPISVLPAGATRVIASLDAQVLLDASPTPTGPALNGAIKQATAWAKQHPDHRVVAVVATDGFPNECSPTTTADISKIAATAVAGKPAINTFTIGVFASAQVASGKNTLDAIAKAGGTDAAFVINTSNDVATQFREALGSIQATQLACEFKIPAPKAGDDVDYGRVNITYKSGKKASVLYYVGNVDECDPLTGGWYYDVDPRADTPTRIVACPTTCSTFRAATNASVEIGVGCATIVK